jgi:predicted HicB family RNase H-like nuclease
MEEIKKRAQIAFDIDPELRKKIKIVAVRRNISMNLWLIRAIYVALRKEDVDNSTPKV